MITEAARSAVRLRRANDLDWVVVTGLPAYDVWFGMVAENHYMRLGIGGIYQEPTGRWWATFMRVPGVRGYKLLAHKAAQVTLSMADDIGEPIGALPDLTINGAEMWLKRLGFEPTDETRGGHTVWVRK